jgi:hypothetical protein
MLNREDVRKVLEAYRKVKENFYNDSKEAGDFTMREIYEAILGEIQEQEKINKAEDK